MKINIRVDTTYLLKDVSYQIFCKFSAPMLLLVTSKHSFKSTRIFFFCNSSN